MNDFWVRELASQRHADYLREVEHAELVDEAKRVPGDRDALAPATPRPAMRDPLRHRWQLSVTHLPRPSLHPHGRAG